jgi:hypothetical protein
MGTGKRRINSAARGLAARVVGSRGLEPELARVAAPELAPVQVAVQAPVLVQGVPELEHARAEAELERGLGVVEPELVQAGAELALVQAGAELALVQVAAPVPNLRPDQLEGRRKTRSAIAAHPHGLVPLLAGAEDLAAAAETTRDPAATEAGIAWAAAV